MTISREADALVELLLKSTESLLTTLRGKKVCLESADRSSVTEAIGTIARYSLTLKNGWLGSDLEETLRGANALTTVNKGVSDIVDLQTERIFGEQAFQVSTEATRLSQQLRSE